MKIPTLNLVNNVQPNPYYYAIKIGLLYFYYFNLFRMKAGIVEKLKKLAARRKFDDLSLVPILTWNNE